MKRKNNTRRKLRITRPNISGGTWTAPHISCDDVSCDCPYVLTERYLGSICDISVHNGIERVSEGSNDAPPLEEAKANGLAISAVPEMLDALIEFIESTEPETYGMDVDEMIENGNIGSRKFPSDESIVLALKALKKAGVKL